MDAHASSPPDNAPDLWHYGHDGNDPIAMKTLGFWLYMISDALIFGGIFAAYGVLDQPMGFYTGPTAAQVVHPGGAFLQTIAILSSVLAYSLATVAMKTNNKNGVLLGIAVSIVLAAIFLGLEFNDFATLFAQHATPQTSGFLSVFFLLIATHGLHMIFGILWMLVMLIQVPRFGLNTEVVTRLLNLRLFWQFQASVWVCVYIFVYLRGAA
jgi:cytochrome o ubiquinol oxidase subunit 3